MIDRFHLEMEKLIQRVRGMNDILPEEEAAWSFLESNAINLFSAYGYKRIQIPVLERTELFRRSIGEVTDIVEKEMYTFEDLNGDSVTLRPEATAGVVRAGLSNGLFHNQQQKLWCSGPMFRHERPQKGRYRQFHQLNVEAVGYSGPSLDAELIVMAARLWNCLGLKSPTLEINSIGTPSARANYRKALVEYFRARQDQLDHDSQRRLERNPIRILDSKNPSMQVLLGEAPLLADYLDAESCTHFEEVKSLLSGVGVDFTENPRLVRGLDYYNRTVFEWVSDQLGAQSAVCSGGRYDGLISHLGGKDTPAVGWALGVERVVELLRVEGSDVPRRSPDAYLAIIGDIGRTQSFVLGESLRDSVPGLYLLVDAIGGTLKSQLRRADRSGAKLALILGNDEQKGDHISVKPLRDDRPQLVLTLDELIKHLRNGVD